MNSWVSLLDLVYPYYSYFISTPLSLLTPGDYLGGYWEEVGHADNDVRVWIRKKTKDEVLPDCYKDVVIPTKDDWDQVLQMRNEWDQLVAQVQQPHIQIQHLWTNKNPSSTFAKQTLEFSGTWEAYIIIARCTTSLDIHATHFVPVFGETEKFIYHLTCADIQRWRKLGDKDTGEYVTSNSIPFQNGYYSAATTESKEDNVSIIPVYIYGVKGLSS